MIITFFFSKVFDRQSWSKTRHCWGIFIITIILKHTKSNKGRHEDVKLFEFSMKKKMDRFLIWHIKQRIEGIKSLFTKKLEFLPILFLNFKIIYSQTTNNVIRDGWSVLRKMKLTEFHDFSSSFISRARANSYKVVENRW